MVHARQATGRTKTRMRPEMAIGSLIVHTQNTPRGTSRATHRRARPNLLTHTPRARLNNISLRLAQNRPKLRKRMARIPLKRIAKATLRAILLEQRRETLQPPASFNQGRNVDLAAKEIAHVALVVVQRGNEEEVHERRAVAAVVEDGLCDFLPGLQGLDQAAHARVGGLGALQEAAVASYDVLAAVLRGVVEFCFWRGLVSGSDRYLHWVSQRTSSSIPCEA